MVGAFTLEPVLWSYTPAVSDLSYFASCFSQRDLRYFASCFSQTLPVFVATPTPPNPGEDRGYHLLRKVGSCPVAANLIISGGDCVCPL